MRKRKVKGTKRRNNGIDFFVWVTAFSLNQKLRIVSDYVALKRMNDGCL